MLFNSWQFLIFFPVVTFLYFVLPHRFRWALLLAASCIFYMAFVPYYILILAVTIVVDYIAGIYIERSVGEQRKYFLIVSLCCNIGFLAFFKYFNFVNANIAGLARFIHWNYPIEALSIILPIGLSFHTFQAMSYTIEVYRGKQKAEKHFGIYALYVMFYPQLVAGPIERPQNLIHQFYERHKFNYERVTLGLQLMLWGLFKKVVIADRLAVVVNNVFAKPAGYDGFPLILATVFCIFQIYCDFSGYSDIAIGAAQVMGFRLMKNFDRPFSSKSMAEFWRRWHISLMTWFRDYVYIPLGGHRVANWRWQLNIFMTFVISGLWHGANWTYIAFGAIHGFFLVFSIWTVTIRKKFVALIGLNRLPALHKYVQIVITFTLVCFAVVFFRAKTLSDAFYIITHMFYGWGQVMRRDILDSQFFGLGLRENEMIVAVGSILVLEIIHLMQRKGSMRQMIAGKPAWIRWPVWYALMISIILFGYYGYQPYIYFQF